MAYYIEKAGVPQNAGIGDVYYKGDGQWSDQFEDRKVFINNPESVIVYRSDDEEGGLEFSYDFWIIIDNFC